MRDSGLSVRLLDEWKTELKSDFFSSLNLITSSYRVHLDDRSLNDCLIFRRLGCTFRIWKFFIFFFKFYFFLLLLKLVILFNSNFCQILRLISHFANYRYFWYITNNGLLNKKKSVLTVNMRSKGKIQYYAF